MQIIVSGTNMDIGTTIREHAEDHLKPVITKYFENAVRANVTLSKESYKFACDIVVNDGTGIKTTVRAHAEDTDPYAAFSNCCHKVEKQLRRQKKKLNAIKRRNQGAPGPEAQEIFAAREYILAHENDNEDQPDLEDLAYESFASPAIIADGSRDLEIITVGEAVLKMDLQDLQALMFINSKNKHISMVYRRSDGNVAWVDSATEYKTTSEGAGPERRVS